MNYAPKLRLVRPDEQPEEPKRAPRWYAIFVIALLGVACWLVLGGMLWLGLKAFTSILSWWHSFSFGSNYVGW